MPPPYTLFLMPSAVSFLPPNYNLCPLPLCQLLLSAHVPVPFPSVRLHLTPILNLIPFYPKLHISLFHSILLLFCLLSIYLHPLTPVYTFATSPCQCSPYIRPPISIPLSILTLPPSPTSIPLSIFTLPPSPYLHSPVNLHLTSVPYLRPLPLFPCQSSPYIRPPTSSSLATLPVSTSGGDLGIHGLGH
ncbi:hypothetical protein Pcinc_031652 [Petrolisthes cinctipes]|uniref:Uncharacterized protein n=1 Tax=Petrolisthes cinctipes TaxID=88211 RepID=A0AAE1K492_PETCI|nr:hypothetical protein Pcinc_031652 [Petrolisthes cinctipes]